MIFLKEILEVQRSEQKPYCLKIVTKEKIYYISCKNDDELYSWMDEIYKRSLGMSNPTNFKHQVHVGFDTMTGEFTV
jgi:PHD/YefM family antitoxin component YafN of YafNO toxin-antitoxin module